MHCGVTGRYDRYRRKGGARQLNEESMLRIFDMARGLRRHLGQTLMAAALSAACLPAWSPPAVAADDAHAYSCTAPAGTVLPRLVLPRLAARIDHHEPVTIVALGSSATAGAGAASPAMSYPSEV